jgi:beta-lactamase class D
MKTLLISVLSLFWAAGYAETYFMLVDPVTSEVVLQVGDDEGLRQRIAPNSTFKIALSLMGFDAGILLDEENPTWAEFEEDEERDVCRQPLTPSTWMHHCCVWYSQSLTRRLGMDRFQSYVDAFGYGNQDLSGNSGLDDGLIRAWINSSLTISCEEQIRFLQKMVEGRLPVSEYALAMTRNILFIEDLGNGWSLFGKTGVGKEWLVQAAPGLENHYSGWFVGWVENGDRRYFFALLLRGQPQIPVVQERWEIAKGYLAQAGVLQ